MVEQPCEDSPELSKNWYWHGLLNDGFYSAVGSFVRPGLVPVGRCFGVLERDALLDLRSPLPEAGRGELNSKAQRALVPIYGWSVASPASVFAL